MNDPLTNLGYFTEWGGRAWESLVKFAIEELGKNSSLNGADLLDIGTRYGKMAVLFSLMGAKVTGIDTDDASLNVAREEAKKWNAPKVDFVAYNGDLDIFPDESFDVVFTKSVLVMIPDLESVLRKISMKLRPNGRVVFLENARGNFLFDVLRAIKHRKWDRHRLNYFTDREAKLIHSIFQIEATKRTVFPPVWLFIGRKRA